MSCYLVLLGAESGRLFTPAGRESFGFCTFFFFPRLTLFSTGQFTGTLEKDGGDDKAVCDIHLLPKQVAAQFTHGT